MISPVVQLSLALVTLLGPIDLLASHPAAPSFRLQADAGYSIEGAGPAVAVDLTPQAYTAGDVKLIHISGWIRNDGGQSVPLGDLHAVDLAMAARAVDAEGRFVYEPLAYRAEEWYGSTFWSGPDWTRVGRDWQHSGETVSSCRTFVAPRDGRVAVSGCIAKADTNGGDGIRATVRLGAEELYVAELGPDDAAGVEPCLNLELSEGDHLRFVLHRRGDIGCDTTHWDPLVEYVDGPSYRASDGFDDSDGPWRYELERDTAEGVQPFAVHYPDTRYQWQSRAVGLGSELRLTAPVLGEGDRCLPVFIIHGDEPTGTLVIGAASFALWALDVDRAVDGSARLRLTCRAPGGTVTLEPGERIPFPEVVVGLCGGDWQAARDAVWGPTAALPLAPTGDPLGLIGLAVQGNAPSVPPPTGLSLSREGDEARLDWDGLGGADRTWVVLRDGRLLGVSDGTRFADDTACAGLSHRYGVCQARGYTLSSPQEAWEAAPAGSADVSLELARLVEADWEASDAERIDTLGYAALASESLAAASAILSSRDRGAAERELADAIVALDGLTEVADGRALYLNARWLRRQALLSDPLMGDVRLLFVQRAPAAYSHLVMQYFGWRARAGGGLFVLEQPGRSLAATPLLDADRWSGSVLAPVLSWDADRVAFSYSSCQPSDPFYHLFELDLGSGGVQQLTAGAYEDLMPAYLPGGDLMLSSTRRKGHARCFGTQFGEAWHVYTLHRLFRQTGEVRTLSFHETNEWFPTLLPDGSISYARWDYVDRHAVLHQNLWRMNPDGTSPVALYGNHTQNPHCSFEAQVVPGTSKLVCTASAHHSITGGSLILVDPNVDFDGPAPVERLTPEVPFPESEAVPTTYYASPWPLSESLFLCSYSPSPLVMEPPPNEPAALGLYVLDRAGNRELLYRNPRIGSSNPIPLRPRPAPPERASLLPEDAPPVGTFALQDVYRGLDGVAPGAVKALRVVQVLPKTTPVGDDPPIGLAGQEPARAVLGTVPVAADGSAYFELPARTPVYFQALDARGRAVQTMRSATYLQPGEQAMCIGCHESRTTAPESVEARSVMQAPQQLTPGPDGTHPFSYPRLVQPVLDRHCVSCHGDAEPAGGLPLTGTPEGPWTRSYLALTGGLSFWGDATNVAHAGDSLVPRYGGWNPVHRTDPGGAFGSLGSRLMRLLDEGHESVTLDPEEYERLALWIDCNAVFYGTYDRGDQQAQLRGETVPMPEVQ